MKALMLAGGCALALATACAQEARAQCEGGGGGSSGAAMTAATTGGTSAVGSTGDARPLTGPGSWAYDVMLAQQMQMASARQQAIAAAQKAAKQAQRKAQAQAVARQRRASELYRRERLREEALLAANR